ncbi:MAG TPA: DHH family phosphoesterase [Patescibacteria group bacterium]|nr:DHH family phosphoesterase [Patescibacteria group bacterium]
MKTIVTHISPDADAITSIWLIRSFKHGWGHARVVFVPAGATFDNQLVDSSQSIIHVDTGLGRFDHHQSNENTCAAQKILDSLKKEKNITKNIQALERMIAFITDCDHFRDVFFPDPEADRYTFLFDSILDGMRIRLQDDSQLVRIGEMMCDGIFQSFINKVKAEKEIKNGLILETLWGKTVVIESENEESSRLAQKKGFALTIRKSPQKGHLRIKLSPRHDGKGHDLSALFEVLKQKDPSATWFFHASGNMILNGSTKNPDVTPTHLTLPEVVQLVKAIR